MSVQHYCWRCKETVPFYSDEEWAIVGPVVARNIRAIQEYRERTGATLVAVLYEHHQSPVRAKLTALTGDGESDVAEFYHHQRSNYGPPCSRCGEWLRTPKATICATCGHSADAFVANRGDEDE